MNADDQAAAVAAKMLKGGAAGDMPEGREGDDGAEGGFRTTAGGQVIDQAGGADDGRMSKANKTGAAITGEPGRQGETPRTGSAVTDEPDGDYGTGGQPGEPGLDQNADASTRARKAGKVGISNGSDGGQPGEGEGSNLSQDEDEDTRRRKAGKVGIAKAKKADEDTYGDDEDDEDDMDKGGDIDADELLKSLDALEAVADGAQLATPADRRKVLGAKLAEGKLSKSEMQELHQLTTEAGAGEEDMQKSDAEDEIPELEEDHFVKSMSDDAGLKEGFDVSDHLERQAALMFSGLDTLAKSLSSSLGQFDQRQRVFNQALAKSLHGMGRMAKAQGELIKSLTERLDSVENQPLPRRGVSTPREAVMHKSMPGEVGGGGAPAFTKTDLLDGLDSMAKSGVQEVGGIPVLNAVAMLEGSGQLPKSALNEILQFGSRPNGGNGMVRVG